MQKLEGLVHQTQQLLHIDLQRSSGAVEAEAAAHSGVQHAQAPHGKAVYHDAGTVAGHEGGVWGRQNEND